MPDTKIAPAHPAAVRESVMGTRFSVLWLVGGAASIVGGTWFILDQMDARMDKKVDAVLRDLTTFREDVRDGLRDLRDEVRLLRTKEK